MRLIDADKIIITRQEYVGALTLKERLRRLLKVQPTVDAIPIELYEQVKGERDVAIEQLKALNIELFEKPYLKAIPIEWIKSKKIEYDHDRYDYVKGCFDGFNDCIDYLIDGWEKENETDRCR